LNIGYKQVKHFKLDDAHYKAHHAVFESFDTVCTPYHPNTLVTKTLRAPYELVFSRNLRIARSPYDVRTMSVGLLRASYDFSELVEDSGTR
jgi:hypothetical protein